MSKKLKPLFIQGHYTDQGEKIEKEFNVFFDKFIEKHCVQNKVNPYHLEVLLNHKIAYNLMFVKNES